jgi:hypothetical protein
MADGGDGQVLNGPWITGTTEPIDFDATPTVVDPPPPSSGAYILAKAIELIEGERAQQHGNFIECHTQISRLWTAYLGVKVTPSDVAMLMVLLKMGRTQTGNHNPDCFVDGAAYFALAGALSNA